MVACAQMVALPGGTFTMGSEEGEVDEAPMHQVQLSPFKIDKYEVSYVQYDSCVKNGACTPAHYDDGKCYMWTGAQIKKVYVPKKYRSPDYPIVCVSWHQAKTYCKFRKKRLPSEAQWEYAALAGSTNPYAWGTTQPSNNNRIDPLKKRPAKPGCYTANSWGLFDMSGNVWEWTRDFYAKDYYGASSKRDPKGSTVGRFRSIRGGGWYSNNKQLRIKNRQWFAPEAGEVSLGIRCVQ